MAFDAGTTNVKDAAGTDTALRTYDDGTAKAFANPVLDSTGAIIDPATKSLQTTANTSLAAIEAAVEGTLTVDGSGATQPVSAVSLPLPTGAATSANQSTANTALSAIRSAVEGTLTVNGSGSTQPVSAAALPLPTGAATAASQSVANTALSAIQTAIEGTVTVDGSGVTQPVSASSLPLPTGAATAANQSTGNTALAAIETNTDKLPTLDNGKSPVIPSMTSGGNISVQTAATGTNYTAFASQACKQLTLSNQSGTTVEVQQGASGVAFQIPTGAFYTFFGITNANQLGVRRTDTSDTQVTLTARWEA